MSLTDWPVPGYVRIVPGYDHDSIDEFFGSIDALLFPSQWRESYGLTVREAVLRGVWPILTDGGGTAEHIVDGKNGTIFPLSGGANALAAAVGDYLDKGHSLRPDPNLSDCIPTYEAQALDLEQHYLEALDATPASAVIT